MQRDKKPVLERYRPPLNTFIRTFLQKHTGEYSPLIEYHLGLRDLEGNTTEKNFGGKALRPTLVLLTTDALAGNWRTALPAAAAIELFHNFTLIHDDIQDSDKKRRGKPSVWDRYGVAQAINAGDALHSVSDLALSALNPKKINPQTILQAKKLLETTSLQVVNGQMLDICFEKKLDVSLEEYFAMIRGKTGILIENAVLMGTLFTSVDKSTRENLRLYGKYLGEAFQIADDLLGIWG